MFPQSRHFLLVLAFLLHNITLFSQGDMDCPSPTFFKTFGSETGAEYANAILRHSDQHLYLSGRDGNRTFIQKMNTSGAVIWNREFSINQFEPMTPSELIEDSEGMIVGCGTQGFTGLSKGFVFRYNPVTNTLLWAHSISSNNPVAAGILEHGPGGNFIFYQTTSLSSGEKDIEIIEIDRATGVMNPGLAKRYQYISSDAISKMIYVNGALYASGTSTCMYGNFNLVNTRQLLARFDPGTFDPIWAHLNHLDTLAPVSFLGRDLLADTNGLVSCYVGSNEFQIGGVGNDTIYLQKTDFNGNLQWVRSYNVQAGVLKLISVPDGYVIYGQQDSSQHLVFKTDKNGAPLWGRKLTEGVTAAVSANQFPPNQALAIGDSLYFTGTAANGGLDVFLWKLYRDGSMAESCDVVDTLAVTSTLVANPFRTIANFSQVFSTASTVPISRTMQDIPMDLHQICPDCNIPDLCPEDNDFVVSIHDVFCEQGKINMQFSFCDLEGGALPALDVTFYNANPYTGAALELGSYSYGPSAGDSCRSEELTDLTTKFGAANVQNGLQIFAVVNVPGGADTPFDTLDFPLSDEAECNYLNNLASFTFQFPAAPVLNLGPDQNVCPNQGTVLNAGAGYFRYQWSNGMTTQTIMANFSSSFRVTVTDFCGFKQTDTVAVNILQTPQVTENGSFCPGESVTIRGFTFSQSGVFQQTIPGLNNDCDTTVTFFITALPYETRNEIVRFCPGDTVVINGVAYYESGLAKDTLAGAVGCDTIVFYFISELPAPFRFDTAYICPGDSVLIGNYYYSQPGLVYDTLPSLNPLGCDTIIRVHIFLLPHILVQETVQFCPGTSVTIFGEVYDQPTMLSFNIPSTTGGCDTLLEYSLEWLPTPTTSDTVAFCQGRTVDIGGNTYTDPGIVELTLAGMNGDCDTLATYLLLWLPTPTRDETVSFCPGDTVQIGGNSYTNPGTVLGTIPGLAGACDTLVTYTLEWLPGPTRDETVSFCPGDTVQIGGNSYTNPGTVLGTIPGLAGACDTLVTYTLEWLPGPTRDETIAFCPGRSVDIDGNTYTMPGTVTSIIPGTGSGCDTLVTYTLEWLPQVAQTKTITFCPGTSVEINGTTYTQPGTVMGTLAGAGGDCDTLVTYTLEWLPYQTDAETISFCPGTSVTINGVVYTQPGTVLDTIASNTGGCDVAVTYTLVFSSLPTKAETLEFCNGASITLGGQTYTQPATITLTIPGSAGACDTIVTYTLQYLDPPPSALAITCPMNVTVITIPGTGAVPANYGAPTATSDCICPGIALTRTAGPASGSLFSPGMTAVCFTAKDSCGSTASCCFNVTVREELPCDSKTIGCIKYDLLGITKDAFSRHTYRIRVTNFCANKLIYTAIQLPNSVTAVGPANNLTYEAPEGQDYLVRNPNYTPFYSIRFKSTTDSIANGQSSTFVYTLPPQSQPQYIHVITRLATQQYYESHLNTFNCPVGVSIQGNDSDNRSAEMPDSGQMLRAEKAMLLFPNPNNGLLFADLSDWEGEPLSIRVLDSRGQLVQSKRLVAGADAQQMQLPEALPGGLYFLEVRTEAGERNVGRFLLER
jgi:HYR domain